MAVKEEHRNMEFGLDLQKNLETITRKDIICTISGGLDSAVAAAIMNETGFKTHFIFFDWGQKTLVRELKCAKSLSKYYGVELKIFEIPLLKNLPGISLTQRETQTTAVNEYVPNRNAILESQAVAYAEYLKAGAICIGSSGGDHVCPDNSLDFVNAMQLLVDAGTMLKPSIKVVAPLIGIDKITTVRIGKQLGVPFELTWSCHNNITRACGYCSNCQSRYEAFTQNKIQDPIEYEK